MRRPSVGPGPLQEAHWAEELALAWPPWLSSPSLECNMVEALWAGDSDMSPQASPRERCLKRKLEEGNQKATHCQGLLDLVRLEDTERRVAGVTSSWP